MAICHRSQLRVYDRTGTGAYTVLPASGLGFSTSLGGGGFLSATAESRAEPIASSPALLDDCVIKLAIPLAEPGTVFTEVLAFANRARNGTLWDGAGAQTREIRQAPSLFTVWSQDAVLHPEGNVIRQMSPAKRYFGWQSTIYDPTGDGWGTPSAATGQQDSTTGNRAGNPDGWPVELGDAYWITRPLSYSNGTRHLFIKDVVISTDCHIAIYWSSDETASVYFAGAGGAAVQGLSASATETGFLTTNYWSAWVTAGTYRVGIDKTSIVTRPGGNGVDPVLLGVATVNPDDGAVDDVLLVTDTSWLVYTLDPVSGEAPSLTPGEIVVELHSQAAARGVDTWSALTLGFTGAVDSDGLPWPVTEERDWRIGYDRYLDMLEGLGDLGFCPEITPGLVLEGWSNRGTDLSATVTIAALVEADSIDETGVGVAATYMPTETEDGWVIVENATAAAIYGRRETALSLGNAPSTTQGRKLGQKVLDDRLSRPETEWTVQFYATARCTPFVDFNLGDTVTIDINGTGTPRVVLDIGGEAEHTEGIIRWTIKTGDTNMPARFTTAPGGAVASGGESTFTAPGTFTTLGGEATASGGDSTFSEVAESTISVVWTGAEDCANYSSGNSSIDVDTYTGVVADDVIVVFGGIGGGSSNISVSSSGLSFTEIAFSDGSSHGLKAWYAIAPDSTGRAISCTCTTERFLGMSVVILRGVDTASPLDVSGSAASFTSTTTPTVPGITTVTAGAFAFAGISLLNNYGPTGPSGWVTDAAIDTSDWSAIASAHKVMGAAGATGDAVFGCTSAIDGHRISFALKPA